ncbi:MAG: heavy metal translocating P-type ATPase [Planctomycetes bacterium]|nr:heavy metal translocating P-type ATPase [Planctomycetota bacterium]
MIADAVTNQAAWSDAAPNAAAIAPCSHCGQPVPPGLAREDQANQFCCHGCETAFGIITSCGLDRYYALRDAAQEPAATTGRTYADFDDPVFRGLYVRPMPGGLWMCDLFLRGVHCSACVWLVERLPTLMPGVVEARLDLRRAIVRVVWKEPDAVLSRIARLLDSIGYPPHPARDAKARTLRREEDRKMLMRLAVAGACAGNAMLFAFALYAGAFSVMEPQYRTFFRWGSMAVTLVCLLWPGSVFFRSAIGALRARAVHLDVPIALALLAGLVWSVLSTIRGAGEIYFDSLSVLVFALLVGRFIQHRQQRWAGDAVELLFSITPTVARVVSEKGVRECPSEALRDGDLVEVRAGDSFPADGQIAWGDSYADESVLTGESRPVAIAVGSQVHAGTVNTGSLVQARVTAAGEHTRIAKLMRMVEQGAAGRARIVRLADRASGWFVIGMLVLSAGTLAAWLYLDPNEAVNHAVALLIVTCPCALGLATPLALTVALGRAAREGLLIKSSDAVQRLSKPGVILLDKTGTLTVGKMHVAAWAGDESAKPLVAALEQQSTHPIAVAIARDLKGIFENSVREVEQTTGGGIRGIVDGQQIIAGSPAFVESRVPASEHLAQSANEFARQGLTPIMIAVDGVCSAVAGLGDVLRPDAGEMVARLRAKGWTPRILSGDHPDVVSAIARQLGIADAKGGQRPEDKLEAVRQLAAAGTGVVMVGDGVNDAAALAAADVGIAVHGGAEASLAAADVHIAKPGLSRVVDLIIGCERSMGIVKRNLVASLFYNVSAAVMAATGYINPIAAAVIMPVSSLTVLALSFKSRSFGGRP